MWAQIMLGVDRLDMIKGIPQKLLAFEKFLEEHPEWRDKVLLVQIAVPTRGDVPEYQVQTSNSPFPSLSNFLPSALSQTNIIQIQILIAPLPTHVRRASLS